jgi:phage tail-like protein
VSPATAAELRPVGELSFLIDVEGRALGRFAECTGLAVEYDVVDYNEGGNNEYVHRLRGRVRYPNVTLKRGVTSEDALLDWFFAVENDAQRPTVFVRLLDPLGKPVREFALAAALPVRWTGPTVNSGSSSAATESLEIAHLGFI